MTTSHWLRGSFSLKKELSCDVVIVGAGYAGLSTAYWLSEFAPELKVIIVDRSLAGSGASGRNAGFLTIGSAAFYKTLSAKWGEEQAYLIRKFASESIELVQERLLKNHPEIKATPSTSMTLFQSEEQVEQWKQNPLADRFGFEWREGSELPHPLQRKFMAGLESPLEFKINPITLLEALKKTLLSRNVTLIENASAFEVLPDGIRTEVAFLKTRKIVLAMNGYFPQFHSAFKDLIIPRRAQMLSVEVNQELEVPHLYYDPQDKVYWRREGSRTLLIGGKRLLDESGETGEFEKISPLIQNGLEEYLRDQLGLDFKVLNRWSGIMGFTEHELPFIGKIGALTETYMIGGFSGHGMGLGFHSARDLAEIITGRKSRSFFDQFTKIKVNL